MRKQASPSAPGRSAPALPAAWRPSHAVWTRALKSSAGSPEPLVQRGGGARHAPGRRVQEAGQGGCKEKEYDLRPMSSSELERRMRQASRLALYGSMALMIAVGYGLVATLDRPAGVSDAETEWIRHDYLHDPTVQLLRSYLPIDTSRSTGNEVSGARFLAAQLAAAGIRSEIEVLDGKHANLYAPLDGQVPHPLGLHNHIDVADVDPREWIYPPFEAHLVLPWIWGRGVFDMKSVAVAQLLAMIDLAKSGRPLRRSVLFLATGDEEAGDSRLGAQWVIRHRPEMVHDFWAVLTEGGTVEA